MGRILTEKDVEPAVRGGSVYAAGGGGWADHGRMLGLAAVRIGKPELVDGRRTGLEMTGSPPPPRSARRPVPQPGKCRASTTSRRCGCCRKRLGEPLAALMVGQNGRSSTLNGWLPSAILGTKVLDAVGDIRAHPTGDMGSIGLAASPEPMIQTAVGGNRADNRYIELVVRGATAKVSPILRTASDMSGGFIASARNPVRASYVRKNAALGGISMALSLGEAIVAAEGARVAARAPPSSTRSARRRAATSPSPAGSPRRTSSTPTPPSTSAPSSSARGDKATTLHVMNEYMAIDDAGGTRLATFPDVITTLDKDGEPLSVGQLHVGMTVHVLHVPKAIIPLSAGVLDPSVYPPVEAAMGIEIARYVFEEAPKKKRKSKK
ncbi:MAG: DUF917 family protein [Candidatus Kaistia colombiensis]|nr:MAG: DUF917 family protein [Kaistia sp.]